MNKVALVVGAGTTGNIGYEIAKKLKTEGYKVVVTDLQYDHADFDQILLDVTDKNETEHLMMIIRDRYGKLDLVVNSAGVNILGPITQYSIEDFEKTIAVNLTSNFLLLQGYVNWFDKNGSKKSFIAITSDTAMIPKSSSFAYGASKAGANQFLRCTARELNKYHEDEWLVAGLALGRVMTPMDTQTSHDLMMQRGISFEEAQGMLAANIPVGRGMYPSEVGDWVHFLDTKGAFASGNILRIDGGQLQG